ncbi:DUF6428 family protein [Mucilaginibacter terrae]|uniref:DUF6428 family protein n=1 Tax=Mucilaginibacter terrae TaxID=1955052 RepID=UPI003635F071
MENLKWGLFKQQLQAYPGLFLHFRYAENQLVNAAYHITEIKQATITSVDCGGVVNAWTEIIVQLWVPENEQQDRAMQVDKALSIINLVENVLPLHPDGIVKIEFGDSQFYTRQMLPKTLKVNGENLVVDLRDDAVQCKAIERGGSCGVNNNSEECCTPATEVKPVIQLQNLAVAAPGSGCC